MIRTEHLASGVLVLVMTCLSVYGAYVIPPDTPLPVHWGISGEANYYLPRNIVLKLIPVLGAAISLLFAVGPFLDPRRENVASSSGLYYASWFGSLCTILILHLAIVVSAAQGNEPNQYLVLMSACVLVIGLGNYMPKSRSSWFIGLRTPWSLTSERAWIAANRATGALFVVSGIIAGGVAVFVDAQWGFSALLAGLLASALIGVAISYNVWRKDPERAQ